MRRWFNIPQPSTPPSAPTFPGSNPKRRANRRPKSCFTAESELRIPVTKASISKKSMVIDVSLIHPGIELPFLPVDDREGQRPNRQILQSHPPC